MGAVPSRGSDRPCCRLVLLAPGPLGQYSYARNSCGPPCLVSLLPVFVLEWLDAWRYCAAETVVCAAVRTVPPPASAKCPPVGPSLVSPSRSGDAVSRGNRFGLVSDKPPGGAGRCVSDLEWPSRIGMDQGRPEMARNFRSRPPEMELQRHDEYSHQGR